MKKFISVETDMSLPNLVAMGKAFSEPVRVRIIALLKGGELCVCELCDVLELPQSSLSTHLQHLRQAGLVETRQDGKWVYYTLGRPLLAAARALFRLQEGAGRPDLVLKTDARKLRARLARRGKDGACCVGFSKARLRRPGATVRSCCGAQSTAR